MAGGSTTLSPASNSKSSPVKRASFRDGPSRQSSFRFARASPTPPPPEPEPTGPRQLRGQDLDTLNGLNFGIAVCFADLVRQVEVACGEQGRAMLYVWNASLAANHATVEELRCAAR